MHLKVSEALRCSSMTRFGHKLNYVINTFVKHTPGSVNNHDKMDNPYIVVTKRFKITLRVYLVYHTIFLNVFQQR